MTEPPLHIVFTPSGAASLRQALADAGRDDPVIAFFDSLNFGPIDPPDPQLRAQWVGDKLGYTEFLDVTSQSPMFWDEVMNTTRRRIVWTSRRSAMEYAGFLECIWRLGDLPCEVIDLTDQLMSRRPGIGPPNRPVEAISLARLFPEEINYCRLYDTATSLAAADRSAYQSLWGRLRGENAPLRVIENGALRSAPITFFDPLLMLEVQSQWRKVAFVVAMTLIAQDDDKIWQTGDFILASRINALIREGRLELAGKTPFNMRFSEIRLPAA